MLRTLALVLACVILAASPAVAKKRHAAARGHAHAAKKSKRAKALARGHASALSSRVAAVDSLPTLTSARAPSAPTPAPAPPVEVAAPAPAPSPPADHGPLGPQAGDDEVPGSRMKR